MISEVRTKKRVADHGEVLTGRREVNAMLDLVKDETERIDSTFLEPACGNGNFLAEILGRKLTVVARRHGKRQSEYEQYAVQAVSSIYGIDLLEDNVLECRERLLAIVEMNRKDFFQSDYLRVVKHILNRNIIWGDALTLQTVGELPQPIIFTQWAMIDGGKIQRTDYSFHELLSFAGTMQTPLFSEQGEQVFLPQPIKKYPLTHYLKLADAECN